MSSLQSCPERCVDPDFVPVPGIDETSPVVAVSRDWVTPLEITALGAVWGVSFMFQRVASPEFGAVALAELRLVFGALVLLPFLWQARVVFTARRWPLLVLLGLVNSAVPFALFAWATQQAPAGISAITNAMAVLFTALVGFLFFGEKVGLGRAGALLAGFAGVVVLASGKTAGRASAGQWSPDVRRRSCTASVSTCCAGICPVCRRLRSRQPRWEPRRC